MENLNRVNISEHVWGFGFVFGFFVVAEGGCPSPPTPCGAAVGCPRVGRHKLM